MIKSMIKFLKWSALNRLYSALIYLPIQFSDFEKGKAI
jgi:hypothetical protein